MDLNEYKKRKFHVYSGSMKKSLAEGYASLIEDDKITIETLTGSVSFKITKNSSAIITPFVVFLNLNEEGEKWE